MKSLDRSSGVAAASVLCLVLGACAVPTRAPAPPTALPAVATQPQVAFVESFMRKVVAAEHEAAFADLGIRLLVNYGRPQWETYSALSPADQERYRRDFVEGIYAFLFRDLPPAGASWRAAAPDPGSPVVEVTGRPGKVLRLVVQGTDAGLKIVMIDRP